MTAPRTPSTYAELVQPLPQPTPRQIDAFVEHVAEADNWLKLLPLEGGPALHVYLDPNAGTRLNRRRETGHYFVEPLTAASELIHGSELPTDQYRARFGYLTYQIDLGAGTAALDDGVMRRAHLPQPGVIHAGALVALPEPLRALAPQPGAFLHGTFRGVQGKGSARRFRYAVERLTKLENVAESHPLVQRLRVWVKQCHAEDHAGFQKWLRATHGESPQELDANTRWQRYIVWRDEETCTRLHDTQDEAFMQTGIPDEVVQRHAQAVERLREAIGAVLEGTKALSS